MSRQRLITLFLVVDALVVVLLGAWLVLDARNPCRTQRPILPEAWFADTKKPAPMCGYRVVTTYPHARDSFIEGLQWLDGEFIESTGLVGQSSLRRVDPSTGTVVQRIDLDPRVFGEGAVAVGDVIYQLTWQDHIGYVYDRDTFALLKTWQYPTEGWGLTFDGRNLVMSDGSSTLYFLDPDTLAVVRQVNVADAGAPVVRLNELEYIAGAVFANVWQTNQIVRIDPDTGRVMARFNFAGLLPEAQRAGADVLNGIAYAEAEDRLFVTGKLWPTLFEVQVTGPSR